MNVSRKTPETDDDWVDPAACPGSLTWANGRATCGECGIEYPAAEARGHLRVDRAWRRIQARMSVELIDRTFKIMPDLEPGGLQDTAPSHRVTSAPIDVPCDGSLESGYLIDAGVLCNVCGRQWGGDLVPQHDRPDLVTMIRRGRFG